MGSNQNAKLGVGSETSLKQSGLPRLVEGIYQIRRVECGNAHSLALSQDGLVYSWGQFFYGALGLGPPVKP